MRMRCTADERDCRRACLFERDNESLDTRHHFIYSLRVARHGLQLRSKHRAHVAQHLSDV